MNPSNQNLSAQDTRRRHILLIEDNEADATLTKLVHEQVRHCSRLDIVNSGLEAIEFLRRNRLSKTDLVLMDMTLPVKSGLELIADIRGLPGCEFLPIVMVSGSDNPAELRRAYELGANCVIRKSSSWKEYF